MAGLGCGTQGSCSTLQRSLYGNAQLAAGFDFTCYQGKAKGQNIFQQTAANVNDKITILKLETSAPEAGFGSPFSWCKTVNALPVKDISQLTAPHLNTDVPNLLIRAESADVSAQIGPEGQVFQGI